MLIGMDATLAVALIALAGVVVAALIGGWTSARTSRATRVFEARVEGYVALVEALFEYDRTTYNRAKTRITKSDEAPRNELREAAYAANSLARACIARVEFLGCGHELSREFQEIRRAIGDYNRAPNLGQLRELQDATEERISEATSRARKDIERSGSRGAQRDRHKK